MTRLAELSGKTVVILVEEIYNDQEFWYPYYRLQEAGAVVLVAGPRAGGTYGSKHGLPAVADVAFGDVDPNAVHGLVLPGGYAPDRIRRDPAALALVRTIFEQGKPLAHICHAGWVLASAGVLKGMRTTSFSAIRDDLVNAGAIWEDAAVVVDRNLISSRAPDDLPDFCRALVAMLAKG